MNSVIQFEKDKVLLKGLITEKQQQQQQQTQKNQPTN